jgi:ArsR family transcriptional regulator
VASTPLKDLQQVARIFRALGDETRLDIITCLADGEECVCNLTDALETGQSRLSFHLKTLKEAGIVRDRREGRWVYYSLNPEVIEEVGRLVRTLRGAGRGRRLAGECCE